MTDYLLKFPTMPRERCFSIYFLLHIFIDEMAAFILTILALL